MKERASQESIFFFVCVSPGTICHWFSLVAVGIQVQRVRADYASPTSCAAQSSATACAPLAGCGAHCMERVLCPLRCAVLQPQGAQCFHSSPLRPTCCVLQHMTAGRWANALAGGLLRHTSEACEVRGPVLSYRHAVSSRAGPTTQQHAQLVDSQRCCTTVVPFSFPLSQ